MSNNIITEEREVCMQDSVFATQGFCSLKQIIISHITFSITEKLQTIQNYKSNDS